MDRVYSFIEKHNSGLKIRNYLLLNKSIESYRWGNQKVGTQTVVHNCATYGK